MESVAPSTTDFDLDISIVESADVVDTLMRSTDDGCGSTCPTACASAGGRI